MAFLWCGWYFPPCSILRSVLTLTHGQSPHPRIPCAGRLLRSPLFIVGLGVCAEDVNCGHSASEVLGCIKPILQVVGSPVSLSFCFSWVASLQGPSHQLLLPSPFLTVVDVHPGWPDMELQIFPLQITQQSVV